MSNYRLDSSSQARSEIFNAAQNLLRKNMALHQLGCPLNRNDVFTAVTTEEDRAAFDHMRKRGYYLPTNHYANAWVRGEGVTNASKVRFRASAMPYVDSDRTEIAFNLDSLDDTKRAKFIKWLNALNRETRLSAAAVKLAREFVNHWCGDSVASMSRRWPEFMLVLTSMHKPWPDRARNLGKVRMKQYEWGAHYQWYLENMKRIEIVGGMFAGATMITVPENKGEIAAEIVDWDKTPKPVVQPDDGGEP